MNQIVKGHIIFDHDGTLVHVDYNGFHLFPGMSDLLEKLRSENYVLHLWTARPKASTLQSLKSNHVAEYFTNIYCSDDGPVKPHIFGLQKVVEGQDRKNVLHIGDSMGDFEGAKNFGIDFIFAAWNNRESGEFFKEITPMVAFNLDELKKLIDIKFHK